ncbi:hypothetical protein FRC04_004405 [Tulasnella sp. 424]|nr:hypothetical protein FRC04_004405 [Tulasnella sp. 424]KAG8979516.1 hypothetical protein FRC05_008505 [Tulasnella sp. 425]
MSTLQCSATLRDWVNEEQKDVLRKTLPQTYGCQITGEPDDHKFVLLVPDDQFEKLKKEDAIEELSELSK